MTQPTPKRRPSRQAKAGAAREADALRAIEARDAVLKPLYEARSAGTSCQVLAEQNAMVPGVLYREIADYAKRHNLPWPPPDIAPPALKMEPPLQAAPSPAPQPEVTERDRVILDAYAKKEAPIVIARRLGISASDVAMTLRKHGVWKATGRPPNKSEDNVTKKRIRPPRPTKTKAPKPEPVATLAVVATAPPVEPVAPPPVAPVEPAPKPEAPPAGMEPSVRKHLQKVADQHRQKTTAQAAEAVATLRNRLHQAERLLGRAASHVPQQGVSASWHRDVGVFWESDTEDTTGQKAP